MSVKDVIGKLQSVDVKDLRNLDIQQVQDSIRGKPDTIVIVLLLVGTIAGCAYLFTDYQKSEKSLSEEVIKFNEQLAAAEQNKVFTQKFDKFLKEFPEKIVTDDLTDKVSSYAIDRNVNIISFSPANKLETEYTFVETININVVAKEYHQLIAFIEDIEKAPYAVRIETWTARLDKTSQNRRNEGRRRHASTDVGDGQNAIAATIEIAAISLKE